MTESFAVAVSVEAPANVPAGHPYAVSESARVLTQLGKERAASTEFEKVKNSSSAKWRRVRQPVQLGLPRTGAYSSAARPTRRGAAPGRACDRFGFSST
jgi:hypothetical protein